MQRPALGIVAFLIAFAASSAYALKPGDSTVIFPIVGRFAGAFDTLWRTDVFVRNIYGGPISGEMTFYVANGTPAHASFSLGPCESVSYRDIVKSVFGYEAASGQLHLTTAGGAIVEARARVFNEGHPAGQFGQGIEGIGKSWLQRQAIVYGLDGAHGARVNVGIANPNDVGVSVRMRIAGHLNDELHNETVTLAAHETRQFNDIFAIFGLSAQDNVSVEFYVGSDETPVYGYASEVRNDTGDAVFTFGTGPNAP